MARLGESKDPMRIVRGSLTRRSTATTYVTNLLRHEGVSPAPMLRVLGSVLHRLAMVLPGGASVRPRLHRWRGANIGRKVWIGLYVYIDDVHPEALSIGENCTIGIRTSIITHFYSGPRQAASNGTVVIERDVFVGPH